MGVEDVVKYENEFEKILNELEKGQHDGQVSED